MTVTYECDVISSFCPMTSPILISMQTSYNNIHMIKGMELYILPLLEKNAALSIALLETSVAQ